MERTMLADAASLSGRSAIVLGGGGVFGATQVGMLRALLESGFQPDLVIGTSVGALNGAAIAANPTTAGVDVLADLWGSLGEEGLFTETVLARASTLARYRTHLYSPAPLRKLLASHLPATFEDLAMPFQCVAASIERAVAHWFSAGSLTDAVMASCAVPGLLPPVVIDGEHFLDGGLVHSIPIGRALALGATEIYVLHVGRIEQPLTAPRSLWDVCLTSFEVARGTGSSRRWPTCRPTCACTCCRAARRRCRWCRCATGTPRQSPAACSAATRPPPSTCPARRTPHEATARRSSAGPCWIRSGSRSRPASRCCSLAASAAGTLVAPLSRRRRLPRLCLFGALYLVVNASLVLWCAGCWLRYPVARHRDLARWSRLHQALLRRALVAAGRSGAAAARLPGRAGGAARPRPDRGPAAAAACPARRTRRLVRARAAAAVALPAAASHRAEGDRCAGIPASTCCSGGCRRASSGAARARHPSGWLP